MIEESTVVQLISIKFRSERHLLARKIFVLFLSLFRHPQFNNQFFSFVHCLQSVSQLLKKIITEFVYYCPSYQLPPTSHSHIHQHNRYQTICFYKSSKDKLLQPFVFFKSVFVFLPVLCWQSRIVLSVCTLVNGKLDVITSFMY